MSTAVTAKPLQCNLSNTIKMHVNQNCLWVVRSGALELWEYPFPHTNHSVWSNLHVASPLSNNSSPVLWLGRRAAPGGQGSGQLLGLDNSQSATWSKSAAGSGDWPWQPPLPRPKKHRGGKGLWVNLRRDPHTRARTHWPALSVSTVQRATTHCCPSVTPNSPPPNPMCVINCWKWRRWRVSREWVCHGRGGG